MRTLAMPKAAEPWSLTSLREKLIKTGAKENGTNDDSKSAPRSRQSCAFQRLGAVN
jgi:hypothetical protein